MGEIVELKPKERVEELFHITSVIRLRSYGVLYEAVPISWFVRGRKAPPVPFERMLAAAERSEEDRRYAEAAACELFTGDEARLFVDYLKANYGDDTRDIEIVSAGRVPLLGLDDVMPLGAMPTGPGAGPHSLHLDADERGGLPFNVAGYYDTRFAEGTLEPDEPWPGLDSAVAAQAAQRR